MKLKEIRKKLKINQDELAKVLNTTQHTISNYENNKTQPSIEDIVTLAKFLNVTADELLGMNVNNENLIERNLLFKTINGLTESECHKLNIYAEALITEREIYKDKI